VGDALGVDEVVAEVLPAQKLDVVRAEQAAGRIVMMVGDGVNDAPALGGADVGVAIGAELNEVALGGADVALLGTDLGRLPLLIGLADITRRVIGRNVWLAFGLSVILIAFQLGACWIRSRALCPRAWRFSPRVVGQRMSHEPWDHDEEREQHHRHHDPELNGPVVTEFDAPKPLLRSSVLPSGPTGRSWPDA
jgi:hypothetical protein